ncbi:hypothetical protein [Anaerotignum sp.]|nr:hypothetical protein [Anaerotignum sp.]MBQ7758333.1 hypothetical protein [Anaerotignum sp.]
MNKLWRWEEKSYQQNKKRETLWIAAVICWLLSLLITYLIGEKMYGGVISTGASSYAAVSVGMAIGISLRYGLGKEPKPMTEKRWRNNWIFVILWSVAIEVFAIFQGMYVQAVQYGLVLIPLLYLAKEERKDIDKVSLGACALLSVAFVLTFATYIAPKVIGLCTVEKAEEIVAEQGYNEAEYLGWLYGRWMYQDAVDKSFYTADMEKERYYMIFGRKDGEPYRFLIDPKGGEVIFFATEAEEPELGMWHRPREQ